MKQFLLFSLVVAGAISCGGCSDGPSSGNTPTEMYLQLLGDPIPAGITNLEGVGDTWQGYSIYLRFHADDDGIEKIVATGYTPAKWEDIKSRFDIPESWNLFSPPWTPATIKHPQCYEADVSNNWTGSGTHYLVIDEDSGVVYFYGVGT